VAFRLAPSPTLVMVVLALRPTLVMEALR